LRRQGSSEPHGEEARTPQDEVWPCCATAAENSSSLFVVEHEFRHFPLVADRK
jgi:hypothetical protein